MPDYSRSSRLSARPPVVLIVDDHEDCVAMYAYGLLAMGFQPVTAQSADEAFARTCELHPDVLVADITLPGTSGLELTQQIRRDGRTNDTRIILLTGHVSASIERQAYDAGCDRFVVKPCPPDALALEILNVLSARENGRAPQDEKTSAVMNARRSGPARG